MRWLIAIPALLLVGGCSLLRAPPAPTFNEHAVALAAPGESYLALSGGACPQSCPEYEIFVFESGRVVFIGKQHTRTLGVVERQTTTAAYFDLRKLLTVRRAFSRRLHMGCLGERREFDVGAVQGTRVRAGRLSYGCFNQVDDLDAITEEFIRIADAAALIQ